MSNKELRFAITNWVARLVGLLFLVITAYGWWDESLARQDSSGSSSMDWIWQWAVLTHLLPLVLITVGFIIGWNRPHLVAIAFGVFAVLQGLSIGAELVYLPFVLLPPLLVAGLFIAAWLLKRNQRKEPQ